MVQSLTLVDSGENYFGEMRSGYDLMAGFQLANDGVFLMMYIGHDPDPGVRIDPTRGKKSSHFVSLVIGYLPRPVERCAPIGNNSKGRRTGETSNVVVHRATVPFRED